MAITPPPDKTAYRIRDDDITYQSGEPLQIDEANGIVFDVWVCGLRGKNEASRIYPLKVLDKGKGLYEKALLNIDHKDDDDSYRSCYDRFGWLEGLYIKDSGLWAKQLRYNVEHEWAKQFAWWVKNNPKAIGLSHDILYLKSTLPNGQIQVDEILQVNCVDVVANPSTTSGLKEGQKIMDESTLMNGVDKAKEDADIAPGAEGYESYIGKMVAAIMTDSGLSMDEKKAKLLTALKLMDDKEEETEEGEEAEEEDGKKEEGKAEEAEEEESEEDKVADVKEGKKGSDQLKALQKRLDELELEKKVEKAKEAIKGLYKSHKLPEIAISDTFTNDLISLSNKDRIIRIKERKALIEGKSGKAVSVARESVDVSFEDKGQNKEKVAPPVDDLLKEAMGFRK